MLILGIDPGSRVTGYGLVLQRGSQVFHVDNGGIFTTDHFQLAEKINEIFDGVLKLIKEFKPQALAIESVFYSKNVRSALILAHARAAAMVAACQEKIDVFEYSPLEVKQAVVGYGRASKDQVQKMVQISLKLPEASYHDASDALAVAMCHLQSYKILNLTKK